MNKYKQHGSWHIRDAGGQPVNLNSRAGADYVLNLQRQLADAQKPKRRGRPKKVGPGETK